MGQEVQLSVESLLSIHEALGLIFVLKKGGGGTF